MKKEKEIDQLFAGYVGGTYSPKELTRLLEAFGSGKHKQQLRTRIREQLYGNEESVETDAATLAAVAGCYQAIQHKLLPSPHN